MVEITDLFRYLYIYENGGIYADSDILNIKPIDQWLSIINVTDYNGQLTQLII